MISEEKSSRKRDFFFVEMDKGRNNRSFFYLKRKMKIVGSVRNYLGQPQVGPLSNDLFI